MRIAVGVAVGFVSLVGLLAAALWAGARFEKSRKLEAEIASARATEEVAAAQRRNQETTDQVSKSLSERAQRISGGGFATRPNAIYDCVSKSGVNIDPNFNFGNTTALAYKANFGDELTAQYMYKYVSAASRCTPFGSSDLQEAMMPALPFIASPIQLSNAIAMAGDIAVRSGHPTIEKFSSALAVLTAIAAHDER